MLKYLICLLSSSLFHQWRPCKIEYFSVHLIRESFTLFSNSSLSCSRISLWDFWSRCIYSFCIFKTWAVSVSRRWSLHCVRLSVWCFVWNLCEFSVNLIVLMSKSSDWQTSRFIIVARHLNFVSFPFRSPAITSLQCPCVLFTRSIVC